MSVRSNSITGPLPGSSTYHFPEPPSRAGLSRFTGGRQAYALFQMKYCFDAELYGANVSAHNSAFESAARVKAEWTSSRGDG